MSSYRFTALGTGSQTPTKTRAQNGYVLRWNDQLILFDPGEGTQRQCTLAGVSIAKLTAICITHLHGDHCLGLPGVIQRRSLDNHLNTIDPKPLQLFFPEEGTEYIQNLQKASIFVDASNIVLQPKKTNEITNTTLANTTIKTAPLDHRVPTVGYRIGEPDSVRILPEKVKEAGITGSAIAELKRTGELTKNNKKIMLSQVSTPKKGKSMAFVMDTSPCAAALELANDVDLLVCEATYLQAESSLAEKYKHMTAQQAGILASQSGAKKLVLTHFSSRYSSVEAHAEEARKYHPDVHAVEDLDGINVL